MKKLTVLTVLWLFTSTVQADETRQLGASLPELLAYAQASSPDLATWRLETQAAQARVEAVREFPDPRFQMELMDVGNAMSGGKTTLIPGEVGQSRYQLAQQIPFWGKRGLRGEIAQGVAAQREQDWARQLLEVQSKIKTAFARYYQAAEQMNILQDNLRLLQSLARQAETRYGVGLVPQQDALRVYSETTTLKIELLTAEQRLKASAAELNALLPRPADQALALPTALPPLKTWPALPVLLEQAKTHSPELTQQRLVANTAEKNRDLTVLNRYPDLTLAVRNTQPKQGIKSWDVMFEVDVPLRQLTRRAQEREAGHMLEAARSQLAASEARLQGQIGILLVNLNASSDKIRLLNKTLLPQTQANFEAAQANYEAGRINLNSVIEAQQQILRTRLAVLDTEVEARMQQAELERLVGDAL